MGYYLDIAKSVPHIEPEPANSADLDSANACRLTEAGWKPKVSFGGVVIWERPDNGFYVSEEMALCLMERWKLRYESGARARG